MTEEKKNTVVPEEQKSEDNEFKVSETWAQEIIEDLDDFIESQGIYLRQ